MKHIDLFRCEKKAPRERITFGQVLYPSIWCRKRHLGKRRGAKIKAIK